MSDAVYVLDSSAVLAVAFREPGAEHVYPILETALISGVNFAEVVAKLQDQGASDEEITVALAQLDLNVAAFDRDQAIRAGMLRASTRAKGLSLGDRACLALAIGKGATVVTTDRAWAELDLPVEVLLIR